MGVFPLKQDNRGTSLGFLMPMLELLSQLSIGKEKCWTKKKPHHSAGEKVNGF